MKWFCSTPMIPTRRYALDTRLAPNTVVLWLTTSTARCLFTSIRSSRRTVQSMASARPWNELQMTYRKPRSDTCGTDPSKTVAAPDTRTPTGTLTTRHGRRLTSKSAPDEPRRLHSAPSFTRKDESAAGSGTGLHPTTVQLVRGRRTRSPPGLAEYSCCRRHGCPVLNSPTHQHRNLAKQPNCLSCRLRQICRGPSGRPQQ